MNADGINYLDMGDAFVRGDWSAAINAVWSPMYGWLLGIVMHVIDPAMRWEFPLVHITNFLIYLVALLCFEFFWQQLDLYRKARTTDHDHPGQTIVPDWAWYGLGYVLFVISSLQMIEIWAVTPDMLMAAFVYLAAGIVVRMRRGICSLRTFALFGALLGIAYLCKSVMFIMGIVFLAVASFSVRERRKMWKWTSVAVVTFLICSLPYLLLISGDKGSFTMGEAGKLSYVRYVNGLPYPHWQGGPPDNGTPRHPTRKILDSPPVYEFATPVAGTYPVSYDPSYWYDGMQADFNITQQFQRLLASASYYIDLFFIRLSPLTFGIAFFLFINRDKSIGWMEWLRGRALILPALAAFALYAVVWVEGRYVAVFVVLICADLLANVSLRNAAATRTTVNAVCSIMLLMMAVNIASFNLSGWLSLKNKSRFQNQPQTLKPEWPGEVAMKLHELGVRKGSKVAVVGYGFDSFWARLARVRIVAEMLDRDAEPFWLDSNSCQTKIIAAFARTGAKAIVAEHAPHYAKLARWQQVGHSSYFIYVFSDPDQA